MYPFARNLFRCRTAANLTQEELGRLLGVTKVCISQWENAERYPNLYQVHQIADALNIPVWELARETGDGPAEERTRVSRKEKVYIFIRSEGITRLRSKHGMTQSELAKYADLPLHKIKEIENGAKPEQEELKRICEALGVDEHTINTTAAEISTAEKVRIYREKAGMNKGEFAKKCGIDADSLSRLENYKGKTKPETLKKIADAMGVTMEELKGGKG